MIKTVSVVLLCLAAWLHTEAHGTELIGSRVPRLDGDVLGAAFYEGKGVFFVQQSVLSTENSGLVIRSHRQLSSWNVENRSMVTKRVFDQAPQGTSAFPCGRIAVSDELHRIFVCSADSHLEMIDPDNLSTVGTMAQVDDQIITDFAVDDPHGRVLVASSRGNGSIHLASYSLQNGERQQEVILPTANSTKDEHVSRPSDRADRHRCKYCKSFREQSRHLYLRR